MKKTLLAILTALSMLHGASQEITWSVDFRTLFDNREGDRNYVEPRTFFQTQLAPEVGLALNGGLHRISAGAVWTQPIGSTMDGYKVDPTIYYRYDSRRLKFSFGMFPRAQMIERMPDYLWSDSLDYRFANIRGALIQYAGDDGFFEAMLDWRGMQSDKVREAFSIQAHGQWTPAGQLLMAGGTAMMNHLAKSSRPTPDEGVVDNLIVNPWIGLNLTGKTGCDSLTIKAGPLFALDRDRKFGGWHTPGGIYADLFVAYRRLSIKNTFYCGKPLYPFYSTYGPLLDMGEPFYQSKYYNSTRIAWTFVRNKYVDLQASLDFKVARDCFDFFQCLKLRVYVDSFSARN